MFVGDKNTKEKTQEEEYESHNNDLEELPEEVRNFAESLNEDYNGNQIKETEIEMKAAIQEDDKERESSDNDSYLGVPEKVRSFTMEAAIQKNDDFSDEAESIYKDQEGFYDDEDERQEGIEASLSHRNSCTYPEQTMQFSAQKTVLENDYELSNYSNLPVSSNNFDSFSSTSFLPNDVRLTELM